MTDGPDDYRPRRALPPEPEDDFLDEDLDVTRRREDFDPADLEQEWRPRHSRFADPAPGEFPAPTDQPAQPDQPDESVQSGPPTFEQPVVQDGFHQDPYGQTGFQQPGAEGIAAGLNDSGLNASGLNDSGLNDDYEEPAAPYEDPSAPQDETRPARSSTIWSAPETAGSAHADADHSGQDSEPFDAPDDQTHVARPGSGAPAPMALEIPGAQSLQPGAVAEEANHETVFRSYAPAASAPDSVAGNPAPDSSAPSGPYRPRRSRDDDDSGWGSADDTERKPARLPLIMIAAAALAIIVGVVFTVFQVRGADTAADPAGEPGGPTSNPQSAGPAGVLTEESMLSEESAADLDGERSWQIASTDNGRSEDSPLPLCVSAPTEGQPVPESTLIRTLTASGGENVAALHQADAYPTADEAAQAYTLIAGSLGGCAVDNAYIASAVTGKNLGNQASGVVVQIGSGPSEYHSVLVSRTGRVVNVLDVARTGKKPASIDEAGKALAAVTNQQCSRVAGVCATGATLPAAPPPVGGDQPGYLNSADFPVIADAAGTWEGTEPTNKVDPATSSQCEGVKFSSAKDLQSEGQVTYLMRDEPSVAATFGIDEIVLTMKDEKTASALAKSVSDNIKKCEDKQLTAKVSKAEAIEGTGAKSAKVRGYAYTVAFELDKSTVTYRVGISSVGNKVVYTFLPTDKNFDFSDGQWTELNVRAGIRASQTK